MLEQEKDWTVLPPELIQIIANKLSDILDFIRFRAACKIWLSSTPLSDSPSQVPWLLELSESEDYRCLSVRPRFYSVSSCQTVTICLNQSKTLWTLINGGVFSHYLVSTNIKEETLSFFNPLNRGQFLLPWPFIGLDIPRMRGNGPDPLDIRSIVVVNQNLWQFWNELGRWAFYDPHNNEWVDQLPQQQKYCYNICYWQGMVFSTGEGRETKVFDASSEKLLHKIPPPDNEVRKYNLFDKGYFACPPTKSYFVESLGTVLRVSWFSDRDNYTAEDSIFHIYKLEFDGLDGQACWVRIDNIGNQVLFLEEMTGFSMTARPSIGFREGCIYFINSYEDKPYVHDILAGTVERVPCPFEKCTWFLPSLC